jgi:hypothetical protein
MTATSNPISDTNLPKAQLHFPAAGWQSSEAVITNSTGFADHPALIDLETILESVSGGYTLLRNPTPNCPNELLGGFANVQSDSATTSAAFVSNLSLQDHQFLESRECFTLPSPGLLKQLLRDFITFVHPHLPMLDEIKVWALWDSEAFSLGTFPYVVLRAMFFSITRVRCD